MFSSWTPTAMNTKFSMLAHRHIVYLIYYNQTENQKLHLEASHSFPSNSFPSLQMLEVTGPKEPRGARVILILLVINFSLASSLMEFHKMLIFCLSFLLWTDTDWGSLWNKHLIGGSLTASEGSYQEGKECGGRQEWYWWSIELHPDLKTAERGRGSWGGGGEGDPPAGLLKSQSPSWVELFGKD